MKKLMLFDLDRTLAQGPEPEDYKYTRTLKLHGLDVQLKLDIHGLTDRLILAALLKDEGWTDKQIEAAMPQLLRDLEKIYKDSFQEGSITAMPGVDELLTVLNDRDITLGLVTGNVRNVAKLKLEAVNLWRFFSAGGGFGDDIHQNRAELVEIGIKKTGFANAKDSVYVIGDTPRDIFAAQGAHIRHTVGVANGYKRIQELTDANAETVLEDFKDTQKVLLKLGVI